MKNCFNIQIRNFQTFSHKVFELEIQILAYQVLYNALILQGHTSPNNVFSQFQAVCLLKTVVSIACTLNKVVIPYVLYLSVIRSKLITELDLPYLKCLRSELFQILEHLIFQIFKQGLNLCIWELYTGKCALYQRKQKLK